MRKLLISFLPIVLSNPEKNTLHFNKIPDEVSAKISGSVTLNCTIYDEKTSLDYEWYIRPNRFGVKRDFQRIDFKNQKYHTIPIKSLPHRSAQLLKQKNPNQIFGSRLKISFLTLLETGIWRAERFHSKITPKISLKPLHHSTF